MLSIRTILYPADFSEQSGHAFQFACSLARDYRARLIVLHVLELPVLTYSGVMTPPPPPLPSTEELDAVREQLHRIKPPDPAACVEYLLEQGDPATIVLEVAQERQCDLIGMGTHGRTGLGRLLMGSVAEQVVRQASCPVLTVKMPWRTAPSSEEAIGVAAAQLAEAKLPG